MFRPIKLTDFGETLIDTCNSDRMEDSKLESCIGIHAICGGFIYIRRVSLTHKAIFCADCHLRIIIPARVATYVDLREYLKENEAGNEYMLKAIN